jgi:hypothetical protein
MQRKIKKRKNIRREALFLFECLVKITGTNQNGIILSSSSLKRREK